MLSRLGSQARAWVDGASPWSNVYGLGRTFIALGTGGTLAFSHSTTLFRPVVGIPHAPVCDSLLRQTSLFCLFPSGWLEAARWVAVLLLLVVASGWRPRITGVLHWWMTASLHLTGVLTDGGDQLAAVLTLLLLPLTLTDGRRWHWDAPPPARPGDEGPRLIARSSLLVLRVQVAAVYFHASIGKLKVQEWADGTALYYWLLDPSVGAPDWLARLLQPVLSHPVVALLTWAVLVLEFYLALGLILGKRTCQVLLPLGFAFHAGIAVFHGLISFVLIMFGALILLLRPFDAPFRFAWPRFLLRRPAPLRAPLEPREATSWASGATRS